MDKNTSVKLELVREYLFWEQVEDETPYIQNERLTQQGRELLAKLVYGEE